MQNFRETVERQLGGYEAPIRDSRISSNGIQVLSALPARLDRHSKAAAQTHLIRRERQTGRQQIFDEIRALFEGGNPIGEIARKLGLGRRRVERWVRRIDVPDRNAMASTPSSPAYFGVLLERRWAEGITKVRHLFEEIRRRGYTGSFSHLARFLAPWRSGAPSADDDEQEALAPVRLRTLDPMTGRAISPLTAAALCVKPRGQMTARQAASVDALKAGSAEFTIMRRLAMQFRGLLRSGTAERLDAWLRDARASGIYAMQRFAKTIRQDLEAVRTAVSEPWSNGQTEGQINKLKTLKRAMYGRAGVDLLRARMMPL
jgi:transposase